MPVVVWRVIDVAIVVLGIGTGLGILLHVWCRQCSAAHVRALRSDDDTGLRARCEAVARRFGPAVRALVDSSA